MSNRKGMSILVVVLLSLGLALPLWDCSQTQGTTETTKTAAETSETTTATTEATTTSTQTLDFHKPGDAYTLQQVVVLSRHNIRAPLSTNESALGQVTPHTWIDWTANASELTMRGGALETMTGEYMRKWLESENLIPENYRPEEGKVRFYANGKQRTIATAQYFSSGMLPVANVDIEVHAEYDAMDPVFSPSFTFMSDSYREAALKEIGSMNGAKSIEDVTSNLTDSYALIEDVVDYKDSEAYKSGKIKDLDTKNVKFSLELNKEPATEGSLKTACQLADALVLQYYECPDAKAAAFGHDLTFDQWKLVSESKDTYVDVLYTAPLVATNVAHPLLAEIGSEMDAEGRVFSFLCGHDSNLASVLSALNVEEYELPGAIEAKTPIGTKLVFERWANANGEQFGRVRLMYQGVDQLRRGTMLSGTESPQSVDLSLEGLKKNNDGLYSYDELRARITSATNEYDNIVQQYGEAELDQAA